MLPTKIENQNFAERLTIAIDSKGLKRNPPAICRLFNSKYEGRPINSHTARNWMLGKSFPTQEKLVLLAKLLDTSPEQLLFGRDREKTLVADLGRGEFVVSNADQQFIKQYLGLTETQRQLLREVVCEFREEKLDELKIA